MATLILLIIVIGLLILVHEWGHFYTARKLGVTVEEFGFGFPPRIFSRIRNGVRYSINAIPFGGFVKIFGEHGEGEGNLQSFISRPAGQRFLILFAGIFMNLVIAWIFFSAGSALGVPQLADSTDSYVPVSIVGVLAKSPAEEAGLNVGDRILEMRSQEVALRIETEADVREFAEAYRGEEITLVIRRGDDVKEIRAIPRAESPSGEGPLGIALGRIVVNRVPWYRAPLAGMETLLRSIGATVVGLGTILRDLVTTGKTSVGVSGPIGIFYLVQDSRALGAAYLLQFVGFLSVNLAILNFLPIPALDGGRIFFLVLEKVKRRRLDPRVENLTHAIGFAVLLLLMLLITYRDIHRLF